MANDLGVDPDKSRAAQLSFKKATSGLNADEERELAQLNQSLSMKKAMAGN